MSYKDYIRDNRAFVFELDNVLYPEKDYWLQVYYLFAQFIEYAEQIEGAGIIRFMEETYRNDGHSGIFQKTAIQFDLPEKYQVNFDLLQQNARLPLKLLLFAPVLSFLREVRAAGKPVFLLVDGDPAIQLNKIRQMEWNGLEQYMKVYFLAEMANGYIDGIERITAESSVKSEEILVIGAEKDGTNLAYFNTLRFLTVDKLSVT
ncbi:HAD family hydrolase [Pedobacter hartonius]|uniref:FMN phosphatase YigB, HAD superfamily n=1 Tax=Pedobacter hartonius TaxID=425514 RepID=A0A1H4CF44_9SPHI|nr:HAD family hydrolase [Pedobacter hartonius]SEA58978.1 FMN phosphatase YigB, HAD superfamily [Pedobacter hartonius]